jgi:arabinoxylan arabinofuranohydrolase
MKTSKHYGIVLGVVLIFGFIIAACSNDDPVPPNVPPPPPPPPPATVTFVSGNSVLVIPAIQIEKGTSGGSLWPANPVWVGFIFGGWFSDDDVLYTSQSIINDDITLTARWSPDTPKLEDQPLAAELAELFSTDNDFPTALSNSWKIWDHHNAVITQGFGADPTVMVYNNRVYVFSSNDSLMYEDGSVIQMGYAGGIQGIRAISSADMVNWTDHGVINIHGPASTNPLIPVSEPIGGTSYATASWAPSATWKNINGRPQFFVYYGNSGNGIGVITADSPTGPWSAPLGKLLIDRSTPNCADVTWLFDPGVMVDSDGQGYMFFGGGDPGPNDDADNTGQARRVRLGADMLSIVGTPETWYVPFLFEASDITKINNRYYFSYVTGSGGRFELVGTQIAYMIASNPMGQFSDPVGILRAPSTQLGTGDQNNHHCIFQFRSRTYIAYHASKVSQAMGLGNMRYRSTFIDDITANFGAGGSISPITMTRKGVTQRIYLNPYLHNEAETIGIMGGVYTRADDDAGNGMVVTSIDTGDWVALYGVDFGNAPGATKFAARVRMPETPTDYVGAIEIRIDPVGDGVTSDTGNLDSTSTARIKDGTVIGRVQLKAQPGEEGSYSFVTINLDTPVTGRHDLVFVFYSSLGVHPETVNPDSRHKNGFEFDQWQFFR